MEFIALAAGVTMALAIAASWDIANKRIQADKQRSEMATHLDALQDRVNNIRNQFTETDRYVRKFSDDLKKESVERLRQLEKETGVRLRQLEKESVERLEGQRDLYAHIKEREQVHEKAIANVVGEVKELLKGHNAKVSGAVAGMTPRKNRTFGG